MPPGPQMSVNEQESMKKYNLETTVGLFVLVGLLCVGYLSLHLGDVNVFGERYYSLKARFHSITGLTPKSTIKMAGVEIGKVKRIHLDKETRMAIVEMRIEKGLEISADAIASVRTVGLLGDKFISISPGASRDILEPGATIVETESAVSLEELIGKYAFGDVEQ